ncbi:tRNA (guanosine(37)-N1)-methyltransferase TrmD [Methylolobus aquaticus]|nr:tRNA (guanosine(37)-N1)-methyltransferase TrmD [Methylolobus aquaticus]
MRFDIVTLFPELVGEALRHGVTGRAIDRGIVSCRLWNPRDFTTDRHRTVDDRPYGGGPGMVMKVEPLCKAIRAARDDAPEAARVIHLSPQGRLLTQQAVRGFAECERLVLVASRYEGIDERVIALEIDEEWSIGDYVLSGGELPALVLFDAVTRLLPGVLGHEESTVYESHTAALLDHPHYTRPPEVDGLAVPAVLCSGDHAAIERWRMKQALGRTWLRRPDLLVAEHLNGDQRQLLEEFMQEFENRERGTQRCQ